MAVLNRALDLLRQKNIQIRGELHIKNALPFGAGLGASASVCVLITNLLYELRLVEKDERFPFARQLENMFHGESSGVDVAVSLVNKPIRFNREKGYSIFESSFRPLITLHYTGKRGVTRECIEVVQNKIQNDPIQSQAIDHKMVTAVKMCETAFQEKNLELLAQAISMACEAYEEWGLIDPLSQALIKKLLDSGAMAVKPTGSGLGGFLLSLWPQGSIQWNQFDCIPAFSNVQS
jgi:mevalonate kinase